MPSSIASSTPSRVRDNRIRRAAWRQGFLVVKSRRRDPRARARGFGLYVLLADDGGDRGSIERSAAAAFRRGEGMTVVEIERQLGIIGGDPPESVEVPETVERRVTPPPVVKRIPTDKEVELRAVAYKALRLGLAERAADGSLRFLEDRATIQALRPDTEDIDNAIRSYGVAR
jgi:hypothetical protein